MSNDLLNIQQAAAYLGVKSPRIHQLVNEGRIGTQIAGHWVFTKEELDRYNEERAQRPKGGRLSTKKES
jgi:excisionase family DNA binding protein